MKKVHVIVGLAAVVIVAALARQWSNHNTGNARHPTPQAAGRPLGQDLMAARAAFKNVILHVASKDRLPVDDPLPPYRTVSYPSSAGNLAAYLTRDPGDGQRHPAIIWAHGGFGGISPYLQLRRKASNDQTPRAFVQAGFVVMLPSWRGENENPGQREFFYGEVDDAVAAIDFLTRQTSVDPARIYMAGHSTGGTVTLLAAEASSKLRAALSLGGIPEITQTAPQWERYYGGAVFDFNSTEECRLRSAIHFVESLKTPTFYFEGQTSPNWSDIPQMQRRANAAGAPFNSFVIAGGDHFNIIRPVTTLLAKKLLRDTGAAFHIDLTQEEIQSAWQAQQDRIAAARRGPPLTVTAAGATQIKAFLAERHRTSDDAVIVLESDSDGQYQMFISPLDKIEPARRVRAAGVIFALPEKRSPASFPLTIDFATPPDSQGFIFLPTGQE